MRPVNISGARAKEYYYEKNPIFNAEQEQNNTEWAGRGAEALRLAGAIEKEKFESVLEGKDPHNGEQIIRGGGQNHEHRAGTDIPFSANKSASYQALVNGDQGLIDDFRESVRATIKYVEENYVYYRETHDGITKKVKGNNTTVASFMHGTSRSDDPNLHCHTIFFNIVETQDGTYKALDNDAIFRHQAEITRYQQADFACRAQERGYEIETKANGTWAIVGVPKDVIDTFSKRSHAIREEEGRIKAEGRIQKEGLQNKAATLDSRPEKNINSTAEGLQKKWEGELKDLGYTKEQIETDRVIANAQARTAREVHEVTHGKPSAEDYVRKSIELTHKTESTFQRQQVITPAYEMTYGTYSPAEINQAYQELQARVEILKLDTVRDKRGNDRDIYSTPAMQQTQRNVIEIINASKGQSHAAFTREEVHNFIARKEATETAARGEVFRYSQDQKDAIEKILTSSDRIIKVQGRAGAGKTSTMSAVKEFYEEHGYHVSGTAGQNKAVDQMRQGGINNAETITKTLKGEAAAARDIVIVDEAGTLSSRSGEDLLNHTSGAAKVIAYGDTGQNPSIGAGRSWKEILSRTTTDTAYMSSSKRFTTAHQQEITDHLERAAQHFRADDQEAARQAVNEAIDRLKESGNLTYAEDHQDKVNKAVEKYFDYRGEGKSTYVQTFYNTTKKEINERIHDERVDRGEIPPGETYQIKEPVNMPAQRQVFADSYLEGQIIRTHDKMEGFRKGDEAKIVERDGVNNRLIVEKENGKIKEIDLYKDHDKFTTYNLSERELSEGDRIMIRDTDKDLKLHNAEMATIKKIDGDNFTIEKDGGKGATQDFDIKEFDRVDHAYAGTTPYTQGADFDATVKVEPQNFNDSNTAITRGKEDAYIIADKTFDKNGRDISEEALREKVGHEAEKTSTLDYDEQPAQSTDEIRSQESDKELQQDPTANPNPEARPAPEKDPEAITEPQTADKEPQKDPEELKQEKTEPGRTEPEKPKAEITTQETRKPEANPENQAAKPPDLKDVQPGKEAERIPHKAEVREERKSEEPKPEQLNHKTDQSPKAENKEPQDQKPQSAEAPKPEMQETKGVEYAENQPPKAADLKGDQPTSDRVPERVPKAKQGQVETEKTETPSPKAEQQGPTAATDPEARPATEKNTEAKPQNPEKDFPTERESSKQRIAETQKAEALKPEIEPKTQEKAQQVKETAKPEIKKGQAENQAARPPDLKTDQPTSDKGPGPKEQQPEAPKLEEPKPEQLESKGRPETEKSTEPQKAEAPKPEIEPEKPRPESEGHSKPEKHDSKDYSRSQQTENEDQEFSSDRAVEYATKEHYYAKRHENTGDKDYEKLSQIYRFKFDTEMGKLDQQHNSQIKDIEHSHVRETAQQGSHAYTRFSREREADKR